MRLPPKKRSGNPILASDWNLLIDAITARTPRSSAGLELVFTSGGFTYRVQRVSASSSPSCGSFRLFAKVAEGATNPDLFVSEGAAGNDTIDETELGSLESNKDKNVYLKVTLDDTDGTYDSEVVAESGDPESDDVTTYCLLGSVDDKGTISQSACGPVSITVCRNWFASESPYYGITVTAT